MGCGSRVLPLMKFGIDLPPQIRVYGAFFLYSFCMGSLFPRIPDIQHAMGVGEGALGLALIGAALGTLVSLTFAGSPAGKDRLSPHAADLPAAAGTVLCHRRAGAVARDAVPAADAGRGDHRGHRDHRQPGGRPGRACHRPAHHEPLACLLEHRLFQLGHDRRLHRPDRAVAAMASVPDGAGGGDRGGARPGQIRGGRASQRRQHR